jgi:hypothetical protein
MAFFLIPPPPLYSSGSTKESNYVVDEVANDNEGSTTQRGNYKYYLNVCGPVVGSDDFPHSNTTDYSDAGVVQIDTDPDASAAYIAGSVKQAVIYSRHGRVDVRHLKAIS